jgi:hypothetical protein
MARDQRLNARTRFLLQDLYDLKLNDYRPRRAQVGEGFDLVLAYVFCL